MDSILNSTVDALTSQGQANGNNNTTTPSIANGSNTNNPQDSDPNTTISVSSLEQRTLAPERFLYVELVKSHLGERASKMVELLLSLGRLSVHDMVDKLTNFTYESAKATLVSLIQLRCVRYLEETSFSGKKTTYYYYNEDGFLLFLYSGSIIEEMHNYFPQRAKSQDSKLSLAAHIIQNILSLGSVTLKDYLQSASSDISTHELTAMFVQLVESEFLIPITKLNYTPINDLWNLLFEKEYKLIPRTSTLSDLKKRTEAKAKAKEQFENLLNVSNNTSKIITTDPRTSLKTVIKTIPLTFNLDRFLKIRRTKQLTHFAKSRISSASSQVYKIALKLTEQKSPNLYNPLIKTGLLQDLDEAIGIKEELELKEEKTPGVTFNAIDVSKHMTPYINLTGTLTSFVKKNSNNKRSNDESNDANNKRLKTEDGFTIPSLPAGLESIQEDDNEDQNQNQNQDDMEFDENDTDPHSITLINNHLKLLASSKIPFLQETRPGVFYVPYSKLIPMLKSSMYDYILVSTLGPSAMRIRRCITVNGLVSEKVITQTALMKEKDIRSTISSLIKYNVVEIQEVPRTADRAASRAVFLFRCNEKQSYNFMKQNLTWNIANLLYKKEILRNENSTLLTKANRDDVKGREAELLLPSELNQLKMVNERELNTFGRISRVLSLWEVFSLC
ncbi:DNA-directed RNA polymerase III subunit C82 NDAI_0J00120 [Naumovozyma dairenensis CBS 421]|uniref:DNA-directed RNA polymerase III subunit RPC3 n=1 Tax=Naumovozyma dairenensis (strain ATCC 10597 / BCRC 20456 / CBS 421 / NBRC 0211 / NRRL Y-12639) TaxID=1071378 RepID=G0WHC4_NAUDC|nr:hypothetical protein NDAI_0J00120 [Naumovozyma dairenensis CBS 421]CCD26904.1 hypothetical protein NDAI_0J00120 [Naumovozyma dairenensis CBS 421]